RPVPHGLRAAGRDGSGRERAHPLDFRRAALADLRLRGRAAEVEEVGVRVGVAEAGRDHAAGRVDGPRRLSGQPGADGRDAVALDGNVGPDARRAAAVDHPAVADEERPGHAYSSAMVTVFIL